MMALLAYWVERFRDIFETPFFAIHPKFIILFGVMTVFILVMIAIPFVSLLDNQIRNWNNRKREQVKHLYKKEIFDYLINGDVSHPTFENLKRGKNKDILINILFELVDYLDGEDKYRLRNLFVKQELDKYCIRKIKSSICYYKAYYLERLSILSFNKTSDELFRDILDSPFIERRMYAMQALISRRPDQIEKLFDDYKYNMSLWEQMNYYMFFISHDIKVPNFHNLALSKNTSAALFAIRMVRMYKQQIDSIEGYESLLKHPDLQVQFEMFRTLAEFGYSNLNILLDEILPKVSLPLRMHIMTYLSKMQHTDTRMLMQYYAESDSVEFRMHILYCIYNFIRGGKEEIELFAKQDEDKMLHNLSAHLITNVV